MTQPHNPNPYPHQPPTNQVVIQQQPSNGLGVTGFVLSLVGMVTCGFLSPLGLLFSLIGLGKRPRGLAIAGTVLGLLGSAWLALAGFTIVMGFLGLGTAASKIAKQVMTREAAAEAAINIQHDRDTGGSLPSDAQGTTDISSKQDAWHQPLHYERQGDTFTIISAGPDQKFGTDDDIKYTENELKPSTPATSQASAP